MRRCYERKRRASAAAMAVTAAIALLSAQQRVSLTGRDDRSAMALGPLNADDPVTRIPRQEGRASSRRRRRHCVVHVHGVHFTGTGYTRDLVHAALGGNASASKMRRTGAREDEGQHLQDVYPKYARRKPGSCAGGGGSNGTSPTRGEGRAKDDPPSPFHAFAERYYCPALSSIADDEASRDRLWAQWSHHWDLTKPYLLQKTPTMDVVLLERMRLGRGTFHVIVMRHPFSNFVPWGYNDGKIKMRLLSWLDIWVHVLDDLAAGKVEAYAVVQYETMVRHEGEFSAVIASTIETDCGKFAKSVPEEEDGMAGDEQRHRKLFLRRKVNLTESLRPSRKALARQRSCQKHPSCRSLMNNFEPVASYFGYSLKHLGKFVHKDFASLPNGRSANLSKLLLFSNRRPPGQELLSNMKSMLDTLGKRRSRKV